MKPKCCANKKSIQEAEKTANLLGIIAEKSRLKILCILKENEQCVCDIWQALDLPQNLVSHHLKVLRDAGFIDARKEGLKVIYSINKKAMSSFQLTFNKFLQKYGTKN